MDSQVSQVENPNHVKPDSKTHVEAPDNGYGKSPQANVRKDIARYKATVLAVGAGLSEEVRGDLQMFQYLSFRTRLEGRQRGPPGSSIGTPTTLSKGCNKRRVTLSIVSCTRRRSLRTDHIWQGHAMGSGTTGGKWVPIPIRA